jgi:hypothetical protein
MADSTTPLLSPKNLDLLGKVRTKYKLPDPMIEKGDVDLLSQTKKAAYAQKTATGYKRGGSVKDWHGFGSTNTGKHKHGF